MSEDKEYNLASSYITGPDGKSYNISTAYRQSSSIYGDWYYETYIWEWDRTTRRRGKWIYDEGCKGSVEGAIEEHNSLIEKLAKGLPLKDEEP